jgi:5-methylcytosine-specific restriction endonuclease McrA
VIVIVIIAIWLQTPTYKKRKKDKLRKIQEEKERKEKQIQIEEQQRRDEARRRFEHQKIRKEIWDRNWGKCELCGRRTRSTDDGYFYAITEDGCIFDGEHYVKEELLLCEFCFEECRNRGVVHKNTELYKRKGIDFRDETHPRHIPPEVRQKVWYRDGGRCQMCGSNENLQYDHIIPFSKGGSNTEENIQLLCEECNKLKLDKI